MSDENGGSVQNLHEIQFDAEFRLNALRFINTELLDRLDKSVFRHEEGRWQRELAEATQWVVNTEAHLREKNFTAALTSVVQAAAAVKRFMDKVVRGIPEEHELHRLISFLRKYMDWATSGPPDNPTTDAEEESDGSQDD